MIKFYSLLIFLLLTSNSFAEIKCIQQVSKFPTEALEQLAIDVDLVVSKSYKSIMSLSINHGGTGDISLLVDDNGIILGLRFKYNDGERVKDFTISAAELNKGISLQYTSETKGQPSPLRLSAVLPPGITASGASFRLDIATSLNPLKLKPFVIEVTRRGNSYSTQYKNNVVKKVTLSPGISWLKWDGTFQSAEFN